MSYQFKRDVYESRRGKLHRAGKPVPADFSSPAGLAEMLRAGDIEVVSVIVAEPARVIKPKPEPAAPALPKTRKARKAKKP